jgi:predicted nucleotidyltransferase
MKTILNKFIKKAKEDKDILAVLLFGSSVSKKQFRDIDVCLVLIGKQSNLKMSKKKLEYQKISDKADVQIFQQLPLYVQKEIIKNNKPLLIKDYETLFDMVRKTNQRFEDYKKYYFDYLEYIKHGSKAKALI